jgi:hypothetical protein
MLRLRELLPPSSSAPTLSSSSSSSSSMAAMDAVLSHVLYAAGMGGDPSHHVPAISDNAAGAPTTDPTVPGVNMPSSSSSLMHPASGSDTLPEAAGGQAPPMTITHMLSAPPVIPLSSWAVAAEPVQINI